MDSCFSILKPAATICPRTSSNFITFSFFASKSPARLSLALLICADGEFSFRKNSTPRHFFNFYVAVGENLTELFYLVWVDVHFSYRNLSIRRNYGFQKTNILIISPEVGLAL